VIGVSVGGDAKKKRNRKQNRPAVAPHFVRGYGGQRRRIEMKKNLIMTIAVMILTLWTTPGLAATVHVPGDYSTIQDGIDAALDGDSVLVAPGTYCENIMIDGKDVRVKGALGAAQTVIDGGLAGPVVTFAACGSDAGIKGCTITNGVGGIVCLMSGPKIKECVITGNITDSMGGGIYCLESSPTIKRCLISHNMAAAGGGISAYFSSVDIRDCFLICNEASSSGGALDIYSSSSVKAKRLAVIGNRSETGSAIHCGVSSAGKFKHCYVLANHSSEPDIMVTSMSNMKIEKSLIAGNWDTAHSTLSMSKVHRVAGEALLE